jgi:3-oxoacyl-[acyl-carrier-protein] synthase II
MGCVTPLGHDPESFWTRLLAGESAVGPVTRYDASTFATNFAAEVKGFDLASVMGDDAAAHEGAGVGTQFALAAATDGVEAGGLDRGPDRPRPRRGLHGLGRGRARLRQLLRDQPRAWKGDARAVDTAEWAAQAPGAPHRRARDRAGAAPVDLPPRPRVRVPGPRVQLHDRLRREHPGRGRGLRDHQAGRRRHHARGRRALHDPHPGDDRVHPPHRDEHPERRDGHRQPPVRPHPRRLRHGRGRGRRRPREPRPRARAGRDPARRGRGYGSTADAYRITDIQPEGRAPRRRWPPPSARPASTRPARRPGARPVQYVSAHGTGTPENDGIETKAVKGVFEGQAPASASAASRA